MRNFSFKGVAAMMVSAVVSVTCCISASAASTETTTTPETLDTSASSTTTVSEETVSSSSTTSVTTTAHIATTTAPELSSEVSGSTTMPPDTITEDTSETEFENPYTSGMLSDDDFYNSILDYLNEGAELDLSGTAILVDESTVNPDEKTDHSDETTSTDLSDSKEKLMYTVVTRDGSTFYIIIDKGGNGENVYFLNKVDIVDLASLINTEEDKQSSAEKQIIKQADQAVGSVTTSDNASEGEVVEDVPSTTEEKPAQTQKKGSDNTILYIIVGVVAVVIIGIAAYKKIGPGKKNKATFDESDDDEDDIEEEYEEETEEEDIPTEEAYDEDGEE